MRLALVALASFALLASACTTSSTAGSCSRDDECGAGEFCIDGTCTVRPDTGTAPTDAGTMMDVGPTDAGPECVSDDQCEGGRCIEQMCCPVEDACGESCCGAGETCFANACIVPGDVCRTVADCDEGEYCETGLGEPVMGGEGPGVCLDPPPTGRCVSLPPRCDEGVPPGETCISECEFRPTVGNLDAVEQWRWGADTVVDRPGDLDVWNSPVVGRVYDTNCDGSVDVLDPPNIIFVSGDDQRSAEGERWLGTCCHCGNERGTSTPVRDGCRRGVLRVLDGRTGTELLTLESAIEGGGGFAGVTPALGDVDHDGVAEIVAVTYEGRIALVEGDGTVRTLSDMPVEEFSTGAACASDSACSGNADCFEGRCVPRAFGWGGGLALGDMDDDGAIEVAMGRRVFTIAADGAAITHRFTGTGFRGHTYSLSYFADVDGGDEVELVAGPTVYRADGTTLWHRSDLADGFTAIGNLDEDSEPEVVLIRGGSVWVLAGESGETIVDSTPIAGTGSGGPPTLADFDGDGDLEIGVAKQNFYVAMQVDTSSGTVSQLWATENHDLSSSVTGSTVFDFEGDGIAEVVYNDECFLWVYDGPTGAVRYATLVASFTGTEASIVADVDGDGKAEMVAFANGADPRSWTCEQAPWNQADGVRPAWERAPDGGSWRGLWVLRDVANSWVGTRPLWNQHSYSVSNVCDPGDDACAGEVAHGAIPNEQRDNWSVPWLNNFRQNVQQEGLFDAPDPTVTVSLDCERQVLRATVRNLGEAILGAGVDVAFFRVDGGSEELLGMGATTEQLFPSQSTIVELPLPDGVTVRETFRARIVVDPAAPTFRECNVENNTSPDYTPSCLI